MKSYLFLVHDSRDWLGTNVIALKETVSTVSSRSSYFTGVLGVDRRQTIKKKVNEGYSSGKHETIQWEKRHFDICLV